MGLVRIECRVYPPVHHVGAACTSLAANFVPTESIPGVNADSDNVMGLQDLRVERLQRLVEASTASLARSTPEGLLSILSDAARDLTGARNAAVGRRFVNGEFRVGAASSRPGGPACPPGHLFHVERGGVHLDLGRGGKTKGDQKDGEFEKF